jgi:hypothetical protein
MRRRIGIVGLGLALLIAGMATTPMRPAYGACGLSDVNMQGYPVPLEPSGGWVLTQAWGGTGDYRTPVFDVARPEFQVEWQAWQTMTTGVAGIPTVGLLQIEVHRMEGEVDTLVTTVHAAIPCQANRLVESGPGRYYLRVVAPNVSWSLMVEEYQG